jgi:hypothetical protein
MTVAELKEWLSHWPDDHTITIIGNERGETVHYSIVTFGKSKESLFGPVVSLSAGRIVKNFVAESKPHGQPLRGSE